MKVVMIGEAAKHKDELTAQSEHRLEVVALPSEAAFSSEYDGIISEDDVVVTLKFSRPQPHNLKFRLLHVPGAGLDGIDMSAVPPDAIVCNVYEHQIPIAEYVMLAMLEWEIRLSAMRKNFSFEKWSGEYLSRVPHGELFGKHLVLVGFGGIGREIARRARAFGMHIAAVDKYAADKEGLSEILLKNEEIDKVLGKADFLVVTCPLTPETKSMINCDIFDAMKNDAVLVNVSRGPIVAEKDLYEALSAGKIAGAVLDVWWCYPKTSDDKVAPSDYPFESMPNVICTPHSCAWTKELTRRRYGVIARNIDNLIEGKALKNVVVCK